MTETEQKYLDAAIDFLRGEWSCPGYVMKGCRSWLPPGTNFNTYNAKEREAARQQITATAGPNDYDVRRAAGAYDEPPLPNKVENHQDDSEHWARYAGGKCSAETYLGRRYLVVSHHGEEQMDLSSFDTVEDLCAGIAEFVEDIDYGVTMVIDLETRERLAFKTTVTIEGLS